MERLLAALCCVLIVVVRSGAQCPVTPEPNTIVQLDSRNITELMWNTTASEDGNMWLLSNTTQCYQEWQYCGGNSSSTLTTREISDLNGAQLTIEVYFSFNDSTNTCSEIEVLVSSLEVVVESLGTISCMESSPQTFTYDATQAFELVFNASFPEGDCVTVTRVRVYATFESCDMETIDYATYPMTNHLNTASGMCVANSVQRDGSSLMRTCMNGTFVDSSRSAGGCECRAGYEPNSMMMECMACPMGRYKPSNGSTSCLACPANSNTTGTASTMCLCDPGYQRTDPSDIGSDCDKCVAGYYRASGGTCQQCPANSNRTTNQTEAFCTCEDNRVTGSENSITIGEDCDACATNYYLMSGTCQLCPVNSSRPFSTDQMSCMCDNNRATTSGNQTTSGDECNACIANYILEGNECVACPENSMRPIEGSNCTCLAGYSQEGDMCIATTTPPPTTPTPTTPPSTTPPPTTPTPTTPPSTTPPPTTPTPTTPPSTTPPPTTPTTPPPTTPTTSAPSGLSQGAIIGIAAGGGAAAVLIVLLLLICVIICRLRANRRGFYPTYEDKASEPPTMLRYSASLRSISSQTVVPADGRVTAKENEFYV